MPAGTIQEAAALVALRKRTRIVRSVGRIIETLDPWSKGLVMSTFVEIA